MAHDTARSQRKGALGNLPHGQGYTTRSCAPYSMAMAVEALTGIHTTSEEVLYIGGNTLRTVLDYGMGLAEAGDIAYAFALSPPPAHPWF